MCNDTPFHQTRMGQQFYEKTVPEIVRQLERLNELLERLVARHGEGTKDAPEPPGTPPAHDGRQLEDLIGVSRRSRREPSTSPPGPHLRASGAG
jgi:hypothetical protein